MSRQQKIEKFLVPVGQGMTFDEAAFQLLQRRKHRNVSGNLFNAARSIISEKLLSNVEVCIQGAGFQKEMVLIQMLAKDIDSPTALMTLIPCQYHVKNLIFQIPLTGRIVNYAQYDKKWTRHLDASLKGVTFATMESVFSDFNRVFGIKVKKASRQKEVKVGLYAIMVCFNNEVSPTDPDYHISNFTSESAKTRSVDTADSLSSDFVTPLNVRVRGAPKASVPHVQRSETIGASRPSGLSRKRGNANKGYAANKPTGPTRAAEGAPKSVPTLTKSVSHISGTTLAPRPIGLFSKESSVLPLSRADGAAGSSRDVDRAPAVQGGLTSFCSEAIDHNIYGQRQEVVTVQSTTPVSYVQEWVKSVSPEDIPSPDSSDVSTSILFQFVIWLEQLLKKPLTDMTLADNDIWKKVLNDKGGQLRDHERKLLICNNAESGRLFAVRIPYTRGHVGRLFCSFANEETPFCTGETDGHSSSLCQYHRGNDKSPADRIQYIEPLRRYITRDSICKTSTSQSQLEKFRQEIRQANNILVINNSVCAVTEEDDVLIFGVLTNRSKEKLCFRSGCTRIINVHKSGCEEHALKKRHFAVDLFDSGRKDDIQAHYVCLISTDLVGDDGKPNRLEVSIKDIAKDYKKEMCKLGYKAKFTLSDYQEFPTDLLANTAVACWQVAALLHSLLTPNYRLINRKLGCPQSKSLLQQALTRVNVTVSNVASALPPRQPPKRLAFKLISETEGRRPPAEYDEGIYAHHTYSIKFNDGMLYAGQTSDRSVVFEIPTCESAIYTRYMHNDVACAQVTSICKEPNDALYVESQLQLVDALNLVCPVPSRPYRGSLNKQIKIDQIHNKPRAEALEDLQHLFESTTSSPLAIYQTI